MNSGRVTLPGHLVPALKGLHPISPVAPDRTLHLSIGLTPRNRSGLNALLQAQDDQKSKLFHHYLNPTQFTAAFGPLPTTTRAVADYLTSQGLHVTSTSSNRALIFADGAAATVEKAFAVNISNFLYEGMIFYAPLNDPSVPATIAPSIQGIVGLDDVALGHHTPLIGHVPASEKLTHHQLHPRNTFCPTNGYYPGDFWDGYDARTLITNGYTGVGETVAVMMFDGFSISDVNAFDQCTGFNPLSYTVEYTTSSGAPQTESGGLEADIDMETLQGMAYSAQQLLYVGTGTINKLGEMVVSPGDQIYLYNVVVTQDLTNVVSNSWGVGCENDTSAGISFTSEAELDTVLTQGAAEGMAFFVPSGDDGQVCDTQNNISGVDALAADPHVVAVGGTTAYALGSNEIGWSRSGGGRSTLYPAPFYQESVTNDASRNIPDVAADADFNTEYLIYCTVQTPHGSCSSEQSYEQGWVVTGGMSAATPLWAGIAVDINQYLSANLAPTLGVPNALFYQLERDRSQLAYPPYYDITSGNNGFAAGPGYDLVTGIGTPDVWNLARGVLSRVYTNIESDVVWGSRVGSYNDLMMTYNLSDASGWQGPTDVSALIRALHQDQSGFNLSLVANAGPPAVISYRTNGDGAEMDVFALATFEGSSYLYGFAYLPESGAWSDLGVISSSAGGNDIPVYNPSAVVVGSPGSYAVAVFGINSDGHLIESFENNSSRQNDGSLVGSWNFTDITSKTNLTCDTAISPAAIVRNNSPVVFADCGGKLVDFYPTSGGGWAANTGISNNAIPYASHAFPGHSLAAMVIPGSPSNIEAYVASDQQGVSLLYEYLYNGSTWTRFLLPVGYTPDQVYAQTFALTYSGIPVSEAITTAPASVTCGTPSMSSQYLYQPQLPNPAWHITNIGHYGVTSMTPIVQQSGTLLTEAFSGDYSGPTGGTGTTGGSGCSNASYITEAYSPLSSSTTQSWFSNAAVTSNYSYGDDIGIEPAGATFPY